MKLKYFAPILLLAVSSTAIAQSELTLEEIGRAADITDRTGISDTPQMDAADEKAANEALSAEGREGLVDHGADTRWEVGDGVSIGANRQDHGVEVTVDTDSQTGPDGEGPGEY